MPVTRKELLAGGAALALAGCGGRRVVAAAPALSGWAGVRAQFALDPDGRHFDAFLFAAHPRVVREAIDRHRRGFDSGANSYLHETQEEAEKAVASNAAGHLGVSPAELAFTDSTTMGLALTYRGLISPGDEVLTTEHDHYATHESLRLAGAKVRRVRLYDDPALDGPLLVVDAVHALGVEPEPVDFCDVFVAGTHKWLGGPRGTGVLWARDWDALAPVIPSFANAMGWSRRAPPGWPPTEAHLTQTTAGRAVSITFGLFELARWWG